jgi:hypothetical protein
MKHGRKIGQTGEAKNRLGNRNHEGARSLRQTQPEIILMRALVLTSVFLLASSALYPASAIDAKSDVRSYEQKSTDQNSDKNATDRNSDNREVGRDWKMKPGDDQTVGKASSPGQNSDDRKIDRDWQMRPRGDGNRN